MQANLFKTRFLPNADGTESTTQLTNSNTVFVHTYLGDDSTGDGTREKPYRSMTKALLKGGMTYVLFRGLINEALIGNRSTIGDDRNQNIMTANFSQSYAGNMYSITFDYFNFPANGGTSGKIFYNCICLNGSVTSLYAGGKFYSLLLGNQRINDNPSGYVNSTMAHAMQPTNSAYNHTVLNKNSIAIYSYSISSSAPRFPEKYYLFLHSTALRINSVSIITPNYTGGDHITKMRDAFTCGGMLGTSLFPLDSFGNETCKVIKEQRSGGTSPNVFNKYDINRTAKLQAVVSTGAKTSIRLITDQPANKWPTTGDVFMPTEADYTNNGVTMPAGSFEVWSYTSVTVNGANDITLTGPSYTFITAHNSLTKTCTRYGDVLDFTLNPDPLNEALWASDTGGYVGCFRPAVDGIIDNDAVFINVNPDGTDGGVGDLFQIDANEDLVFNGASSQTWNRFRDQQSVQINQGASFKGLNAMSTDGSPFGFYIGKKQNLIDTTPKYPGDELVVGQMYKIFNDSGQDVTRSIVYNNVQYLPEYTFYCVQGVSTFSLLNAGTGTYVKAVNADVLESIEILPYDDLITPSTIFPKFSAPLMGDCKLLFYTAAGAARYGKTSGQPVTFADLAIANMITDFPRGLNNTWLTVATTAAAATTITVNDTTNYPSSGVVYFGTTKFTYTSKTATTLVGASQTLTTQPIGTLVNLVNRLDVSTISLYDSYAISNADREFFILGNPNLPSPLSTYFTTSIPNIRFLRREINGHFDLPYDY